MRGSSVRPKNVFVDAGYGDIIIYDCDAPSVLLFESKNKQSAVCLYAETRANNGRRPVYGVYRYLLK
jgi:hypothetical protein